MRRREVGVGELYLQTFLQVCCTYASRLESLQEAYESQEVVATDVEILIYKKFVLSDVGGLAKVAVVVETAYEILHYGALVVAKIVFPHLAIEVVVGCRSLGELKLSLLAGILLAQEIVGDIVGGKLVGSLVRELVAIVLLNIVALIFLRRGLRIFHLVGANFLESLVFLHFVAHTLLEVHDGKFHHRRNSHLQRYLLLRLFFALDLLKMLHN